LSVRMHFHTERFPDKEGAFARMKLMLRDGGMLLLSQASINNLYDALVLSIVKLTTSRASYFSRKVMRRLGGAEFGSEPDEIRISPGLLVPSIYLFKWTRNMGSEQ